MAVLSDAFLLANACTCLAEHEDTEVQMISKVIGHLTEGEVLKIYFQSENLNLEFWNELICKWKRSRTILFSKQSSMMLEEGIAYVYKKKKKKSKTTQRSSIIPILLETSKLFL